MKLSKARSSIGNQYPRRRDTLLWYLTWSLSETWGGRGGRTASPAVAPRRGLLLSQQIDSDFGGSERRRLAERLMAAGVAHEVLPVSDLDGVPSPRERVVSKLSSGAFDVLIVDYTSGLGRGSARVLREAALLARYCRRSGIPIIVTLYDLLDPTEAAAAQLLSRSGGRVWVMGNTSEEAHALGLRRAVGPCGTVIAPYARKLVFPAASWQAREYDVIYPYPGGHEVRDQLITTIKADLDTTVRQCRLPRQSSPDDWRKELSRSRSTVVVNDIRAPYLRLPRHPGSPKAPTQHAVGRNLEALATGVVLISQTCPAILRWLEPMEHFLAWEDPVEASGWIRWVQENPDDAEQLATRGLARLQELEGAGVPIEWLP